MKSAPTIAEILFSNPEIIAWLELNPKQTAKLIAHPQAHAARDSRNHG